MASAVWLTPYYCVADLLGQLMYQLGESYERLISRGDATCERRIACEAKADDADLGGDGQPLLHPDAAARVRSLLR